MSNNDCAQLVWVLLNGRDSSKHEQAKWINAPSQQIVVWNL